LLGTKAVLESGKARLALPSYERRSVELARREHCLFVDNFADWQKLKWQPNLELDHVLSRCSHPS